MKEIKLRNIIFPIWLLLFFPPLIFITLAANFIIDSLVILGCFKKFKLVNPKPIMYYYKKSIIKVWLFGFLADFIGATILFVLGILGDSFGLSYELINGINYDPFSNPLAVIIILIAILISGFFIFLFNYRISFRELVEDLSLRFKLSLTIAIITMPWTFLLPTRWFYY